MHVSAGAAAGTTRAAHTDSRSRRYRIADEAAREPRARSSRRQHAVGPPVTPRCGDCRRRIDIVAAWRRRRRPPGPSPMLSLGVDLHREHSRGSGTTETLSHVEGCASAEPRGVVTLWLVFEPFRRIARFGHRAFRGQHSRSPGARNRATRELSAIPGHCLAERNATSLRSQFELHPTVIVTVTASDRLSAIKPKRGL